MNQVDNATFLRVWQRVRAGADTLPLAAPPRQHKARVQKCRNCRCSHCQRPK